MRILDYHRNRYVKHSAALCLLMLFAACSPIVEERGYVGLERSAGEIHEGMSREAVLRLLGSPSSQSMFGEEIWYYIRTVNETKAFLHPEVATQKVIALHFHDDGTVGAVEQYDTKDGRAIAFSDEKTPTEGNSFGVMEQLLGNLGRFNSNRHDKAVGP